MRRCACCGRKNAARSRSKRPEGKCPRETSTRRLKDRPSHAEARPGHSPLAVTASGPMASAARQAALAPRLVAERGGIRLPANREISSRARRKKIAREAPQGGRNEHETATI